MILVGLRHGAKLANRNIRVPEKLKCDAIIEAIVELRFETETQPEFLIVGLAGFEPWKNYRQSRLPAHSIPDQIRQADPNLRHQPTFELLEPANRRSVRIGPNVLSYHLRAPYVGWKEFGSELSGVVLALFNATRGLNVTRLGLRYINALTTEEHGISGVPDLDVRIHIGPMQVTAGLNVNVRKVINHETACMVRVATPEFVTGMLPNGTNIIADVDVFSNDEYRSNNADEVVRWVAAAHEIEKREFFALLTDQTIQKLEVQQS